MGEVLKERRKRLLWFDRNELLFFYTHWLGCDVSGGLQKFLSYE
jgi:hypothetical protein